MNHWKLNPVLLRKLSRAACNTLVHRTHPAVLDTCIPLLRACCITLRTRTNHVGLTQEHCQLFLRSSAAIKSDIKAASRYM